MNKRKRIVIIGGSAAGPKAAAKARRIDNNAEVVILQKDADLSMASCGYPITSADLSTTVICFCVHPQVL